jgi:branched-chain amino acid transport system permease protein
LALASPKYEPASLFWTLPLATLAAAAAALAIGALSLRTRGVYFIMVTLAFGQMLFYVFYDTNVAGGSDGFYIYNKPDISVGGMKLLDLERPAAFYYLVLGVLTASILLLVRLVNSPFGRALAAARDNERRARALGYPIYRVRLVAFVISGALAGIAGYFAAAQFGFVAPQMLGWHASAILLVMVVLGGMATVTGPLVGAVVLLGLEEVLKVLTPSYWAIAMGAIILGVVLWLPGGARQLLELATGRRAPEKAGRRQQPVAVPAEGVGRA